MIAFGDNARNVILELEAFDMLVVGINDERFALLQHARQRVGAVPAQLISYADALRDIERCVRPNMVVRFESTDEERDALRCYFVAGAGTDDSGIDYLDGHAAATYAPEPGEIRYMSQLHRGRCRIWTELEVRVLACGASTMNSAAALAVMFDKRSTVNVLRDADVPVPMSGGPARSFDDVVAMISEMPGRQMMVKTAHGAGATGAIALRTDGTRWHASTTAILYHDRLWNTRRVHAITNREDIRSLINAVCQQTVHVEQWIPKATVGSTQFDLRVVVIGGVARHVVMRCARGPFTNLHLGAQRGDVVNLRSRMGEELWMRAMRLAESAVTAIGSHGHLCYAGVDIVVHSDWVGLSVLEVNGFGDWHPDVFVDGLDTYDWEMRALLQETSRAEVVVEVAS